MGLMYPGCCRQSCRGGKDLDCVINAGNSHDWMMRMALHKKVFLALHLQLQWEHPYLDHVDCVFITP